MLRNPLGTYREYIVTTYWEPRKMEKSIKSSPRPPKKTLKEKKKSKTT
jgi:hypothetical protein